MELDIRNGDFRLTVHGPEFYVSSHSYSIGWMTRKQRLRLILALIKGGKKD